MYAENARNRMLLIMLALIAAMSMSFNIKQLFDINYYRNIASEAQEVLRTAMPAKVLPNLSVARTKEVNRTELHCMAESIYFEASSQSLVGKIAVGMVVLNRVSKPNYPKTVCGVVNQRLGDTCMFSWTCQDNRTIRNQAEWKQSQQVAYDLLSRDRKDLVDITEGATHFHNASVKPGWRLKKVAKIDDHQFYK